MADNSTPSERRPTGIAGLDRILEGGLLTAGVYIVQGPPGAGKTILANQACFHHASTGGRAVYVTLLAESHSRMFAHLRRMAFFDEAAIAERVYYLGGYSALESDGLDALVTLVRQAIQKHHATLLVVDGLVSAHESSPTDREFKKFLHEIQTLAELTACTVLLLTNAERASGFFPEHTMVDGVLHLTDELSELRPAAPHPRAQDARHRADPRPALGADHRPGARGAAENRIAVPGSPGRRAPVATGAKLGFGLSELDDMLRGGVRSGSITMLLGSSGAGKTLLGMQFLSEGVKRGERCRLLRLLRAPGGDPGQVPAGRHRRPERRRRARHRGDRLAPTGRRRDRRARREPDRDRQAHRADRLVIDGMQGFELAADFPERLSHVYSAIAQELELLGVTTLYTTETRELFARNIEVPITGLSAATQNIILLRHIEHRAAMRRVLGIPQGPRRRLRRPHARAADHRRRPPAAGYLRGGGPRRLRRRRRQPSREQARGE